MKDTLNKALAANAGTDAVYHHVTDDNRLNYRIDVNDATFEWHNNTWMQVADNA